MNEEVKDPDHTVTDDSRYFQQGLFLRQAYETPALAPRARYPRVAEDVLDHLLFWATYFTLPFHSFYRYKVYPKHDHYHLTLESYPIVVSQPYINRTHPLNCID